MSSGSSASISATDGNVQISIKARSGASNSIDWCLMAVSDTSSPPESLGMVGFGAGSTDCLQDAEGSTIAETEGVIKSGDAAAENMFWGTGKGIEEHSGAGSRGVSPSNAHDWGVDGYGDCDEFYIFATDQC
jgi:hypothetical protein